MKHILTIFVLLLLVGCNTKGPAKPDPVAPVQVEDGIYCQHKYDGSLNFTYIPPVVEFENTMFGETVITYELTLTDGSKRFLNQQEEENYQCDPVE